MKLDLLIKNITPLYNNYRTNKADLSGVEALIIMWDIGDFIKEYLSKIDIAPHALYRQIYGKSEGKDNIAKRSYITREFLGRCYRIRNLFISKHKLKETFPNLKYFIAFREAMPFFDNKKYKLSEEDHKALLALLNSNESRKNILLKIDKLQKSNINYRPNTRKQKLEELDNEKQIFIDFYNYIFKLVSRDNYEDILEELKNKKISEDCLRLLAKNTEALSGEGLKFYEMDNCEHNDLWNDYRVVIDELVNQPDAKQRRRFRRVISPARIARLSEMLFALLSKDIFTNFK